MTEKNSFSDRKALIKKKLSRNILINKRYFHNLSQDKILTTNSIENNHSNLLNKSERMNFHNSYKSDDSFNKNKSYNSINLMNNVSGDKKKKIKLKININKYNMKNSTNKLDKFLQNMKIKNKLNYLRRNLKINKSNISRPSSSPGKSIRKSQDSKINLSEINFKRSFRRENTLNLSNNFYEDIKNNSLSLTNKDLFSNCSNSLRKKFLETNSDYDMGQFQSFRSLNRRSFIKNSSKFNNRNNIFKLNKEFLPPNLEYQKNFIKLNGNQRIKSFTLNKYKTFNSYSETFDNNETKTSINKLYTINNTIKIENNEIINGSPNKKNFKRRKSLKKRDSIYNKIKEGCSKHRGSIFMKELKLSVENIPQTFFFEIEPTQKKFLKKQYSEAKNKMKNIQKNKNNFLQILIDKKVKDITSKMEEMEKNLLKKELNTFLGKEETLKKIYKNLFFQINKKRLRKFFYMVLKSIYSFKKKNRIIRSFYTVAFPFLLDKYLNPRKGILTLIFRFGIERKTYLAKPKRKLNTLRLNKFEEPNQSFLQKVSSFQSNSHNKNNYSSHCKTLINNNDDSNRYFSNVVKNFNKTIDIRKVNIMQLIKQKREFFPEKTITTYRNKLLKIDNLLEKAKVLPNNILYVHEFLSNDTSHYIENQPLIDIKLKSYRIKYFSTKTIKKSQTIIKVKKKKTSLLNQIFFSHIDNKIGFFSSQKYILDNFISRPKKKLKTIRKKYRKEFNISNNIFSATNKDITNIKTQLIKALELKRVENNLYKVIFHYINDDNIVLVKKTINDNYGFMNINYKDEKGYTFLNCAVKSDCKKEIIQFLLNKGCNPNIGNVRLFFNFRIKEIALCILQCLIKIIQLLIY